jgi:hypothetical protein
MIPTYLPLEPIICSDSPDYDIFRPNGYYYKIIPSNYNNTSHITVWDEFFINQNIMKPNEINMLLSVENVSKWKYQLDSKKA